MAVLTSDVRWGTKALAVPHSGGRLIVGYRAPIGTIMRETALYQALTGDHRVGREATQWATCGNCGNWGNPSGRCTPWLKQQKSGLGWTRCAGTACRIRIS